LLRLLKEMHEIGETLIPIFLALHLTGVLLDALWGQKKWREQLLRDRGVDYSKTPAEDFATGMITYRNPETGQIVKSQFTDSWMFEKQGLRLFMDGMGPGYAFEINTLVSPLNVFIGDVAAQAIADQESALEKATASRGLLAVQYNEADLYGYTDENVDMLAAFSAGCACCRGIRPGDPASGDGELPVGRERQDHRPHRQGHDCGAGCLRAVDTTGQGRRAVVAMNTKPQRDGFPILRDRIAPARGSVATCGNSMRRRCSALRGLLMATALIAGALMAAAPAGALPWLQGKFTGEEMLAHCKATDKDPMQDFGRGICTGFIDGFAAGHFVAETWHAFHHRDEKRDEIFGHLCAPESTTRGQLARVFVQFLEKNPEKIKLPAGLLLEDALRESFPCPK
jgi:hypothetical protein